MKKLLMRQMELKGVIRDKEIRRILSHIGNILLAEAEAHFYT